MQVLVTTPSALITDIDGTISPIVARPEDARVSPLAKAALEVLTHKLALVGVVTAREEAVARRMVGIDGLTYVGNYALAATALNEASPQIERAKALAQAEIVAMPCVTLEDKGITFALHYRNCEDADLRERLLSLVQPIAAACGLKVLEGKQVVELAPRELPDKGTAIARLAEERGIRGLVYLGDDLSDVAVFREIARRRREDGLPGVGIAVIDAETDAAVSEAADMHLARVAEVEALLSAIARSLEEEGRT